jgi:hypothetical protein
MDDFILGLSDDDASRFLRLTDEKEFWTIAIDSLREQQSAQVAAVRTPVAED